MTKEIKTIHEADRAIASIENVKDGTTLRDYLQSIVDLAKRREVYYEQQFEWEDRVRRTERKIGAILAELPRQSGKRTDLTSSHDATRLQDAGIGKDAANRWQWEARLTEAQYEDFKSQRFSESDDLSATAVMQYAKRLCGHHDPIPTPPLPTGQYRTIVVDPPWPVKKILRDVRPLQAESLDYPIMKLDEISALPISQLFAPDGAHIYLWTTQKFLPDSFRVMAGWGANYQCLLTWIKPVGFTPFSWMFNTEHALFGTVGGLGVVRKGLKIGFSASVGRSHSTKPDIFYDMVKQASPGPYLEMFARGKRDGWDTWGNEAG